MLFWCCYGQLGQFGCVLFVDRAAHTLIQHSRIYGSRDRVRRCRFCGRFRYWVFVQHERRFANPYVAAERGYLDAVTRHCDTRPQADSSSGHAGKQTRQKSTQEAREHPAVSTVADCAPLPDEA
jgi:hypothetical protein